MEHRSVVEITNEFVAQQDSWPQGRLMRSLNCPYAHSLDGPVFSKRPVLNAGDRASLRISIPRILAVSIDDKNNTTFTASLLSALDCYDCLAVCREDTHTSFELARALLLYLARFEDYPMNVFARPRVISLLNNWLEPEKKWRRLPSALEVCQHLFGDAWCTLCLPETVLSAPGDSDRRGNGLKVLNTVNRLRPTLSPGLCLAETAEPDLMLPTLDGASDERRY
jgi:hypothetical protein